MKQKYFHNVIIVLILTVFYMPESKATSINVPTDQEILATDLYAALMKNNSATSLNTPNTVVMRDANGNFASNIITANILTGTAGAAIYAHQATTAINAFTAATATSATNAQFSLNAQNATTALNTTGTAGAAIYAHQANSSLTAANAANATTATNAVFAQNLLGNFAGDISGIQTAITVGSVGGQTASQIAASAKLTQAATTISTPNTLVSRNANGDSSFRAINASMALNLTGTGSLIYLNNNRMLHAMGDATNSNIFVGSGSGSTTITSTRNTALGAGSLQNNRLGSNNLALGYGAGSNLTYGNNNIFIGNSGTSKESSTIRLGSTLTHTACFISGISGAPTGAGSVAVFIDNSGRLATKISSERYKKDITDLADKTEQLAMLRPVSFKYKNGSDESTHYGLIAEEVAKILPEMAVYTPDGQIHTVAYDMLPIYLLQYTQHLQKELASCLARLEDQQLTIEELKQVTKSYEVLQKSLEK